MANKERIFIALRPDAQVCKDLIKIQHEVIASGRVVPPQSLHLTLAFLGDCDSERKRCVLDKITSVNSGAFDMELAEFGYFERHRIFYIAPNIIPIELLFLHKQLCKALSTCQFRTPRAFKPHVSLFRGVKTPPFCEPLSATIKWHVRSIHAERSELSSEGAHYTTLKEQPLLEPPIKL